MKHKWHEEIVAWADGEQIEFNSIHNPVGKGWVSPLYDEYTPDWNNPNLYFRVVKPWFETIPEQGRLCWVSNYDSTEKNKIAIIVYFNNGYYITQTDVDWKYATPLTNEEITQFLN